MAFVDTVVSVIVGAQTEILIFLIAVCAHALLFSSHHVGKGKKGTEKAQLSSASTASGSPKSGTSPRSPRQPGAAPSALVRAVQALVSSRASQDDFAEELDRQLKSVAPELKAEVLTSLLGGLGKSISCHLLAACRGVARDQCAQPGAQLFENLARGYLLLKKRDEFQELLSAAEAEVGTTPGLAALALRAAVQASDVQAALARLPVLAPAWKANTPSTAHGQLFHQLVRLAADKGALSGLLDDLQQHDLFVSWTVGAVLVECAAAQNMAELQKVLQLALERGVQLSANAHGALIRSAATAEEAVGCLEEAAAAGHGGREALLAAAAVATKLGSAEVAAAAVAHMGASPASEVLAALLHLHAPGAPLAGQDADDAILQLFTQRRGKADLSADPRAERLVANAALRKGRKDALEELMGAAAVAGDNARQVALLKSLSGEKRLQDCIKIFRACPNKTSCLYNAVLDACIDCGDARLAERLMDEAMEAKLADVVTYNTMIKAHLRKGDAKRARAAMATMRGVGLEPNCVTFNEMIDATVQHRPDLVWGLVDEMTACGCKPNHVTCSIVLKSVSKASRSGDVEKALAVVNAMDDAMDEVLLSSVCEACIRSGRTDLLRKQLQRQKGCRSIQVKGAHTFGSIIRAYGTLSDMDEVWSTWREMKKRHVLPTSVTLGCMVEALAANGQVDAGYDLIREQMRDPTIRPMVNAVIYCSVLKGYSHGKRFQQVWTVCEEMKAEKMQFSIVTYNTLVDACARSNDMGRIPALLEEMAAQQIEPNLITYSTIIKGYCQENRVDRAFELLEDMKKVKSFTPDEVTYNTLIDGCARYGMWEKGLSVLEEMQAVGVPPSAFTLSVLVKLAHRSKRPENAFELVESLCAKYHIRLTVHVVNNLINACAALGDLQKAFSTMEDMLRDRVRPDSRTYTLMLRAAVGAKSAQDAAGLLRAAAGLRGAHPRLAGFGAGAVQPRGGLPEATVSEALEGIAGACGEDTLALQLFSDLRHASGIALDSALKMRLTKKAMRGPSRQY